MQTELLTHHEIDAALEAHRVPGAGITVMDGNRIVWARSSGLRSVRGTEPVDADTSFATCSMTKTVTGLLFMTLARDGLVDLDTPANRYLTGWKLQGIDADSVTVAMLLTHTGGTSVHGFWGYTPGVPVPSLDQILDGEPPANSPPVRVVRPPRVEFSYSGGGTTVLQKFVGDVTGQGYAQLVRERILLPLGMRHSAVEMRPTAANLALGHRDGVMVRGGYCVHPEMAAGGLWSTGSDYALLLAGLSDAVNGRPGALVPQPLAARMITPTFANSACGCFAQRPGIISHAGGRVGYRSHYVFDVATGRGVITLANAEEGAIPLQALRHTICARLGWDLPGDPPA